MYLVKDMQDILYARKGKLKFKFSTHEHNIT